MIEKLIEQQKTIKSLEANQDSLLKIMKKYEELKLRNEKAINYIETTNLVKGTEWYRIELLDILKGEYNE